jgi:hypothetical protein
MGLEGKLVIGYPIDSLRCYHCGLWSNEHIGYLNCLFSPTTFISRRAYARALQSEGLRERGV